MSDATMLTGQAVRLCPLDRSHLALTLEWVNDPELAALLDRARPVTAMEHQEWYERVTSSDNCQYFAIETTDGGAHIGNVWLWDIDQRHRRAEVRILVGDRFGRNRGFGTEALQLITTYAFEGLNLHKVYAYVLAINPRAKRSFEKAGYAAEGLLRADRRAGDHYVDVHFLGRVREDPT